MNKSLLITLMAGCIFSTSCTSTSPSHIQKTENMMINLEKTKPYCIGRYIVDIPAEANPLKRFDQYDSFYIEVKNNATRQDFDAAVQEWRSDYSKGNRKVFEDPQEQKIDGRITKIFKGKLAK